MEISVRSYLTAGTVAVVGAGAIALAPVVPATSPAALGVPAPAVADVALTAFSFSLSDVLGLLGNFGIGGALPDVLGALPSLLPGDIVTAVVTEFVNQAGPLVTAAASEVFGYLGTAVIGLLIGPDSIPSRFGGALADIPVVLYHQLPAECPYVDRQHQVIASLDLLSRDRSLAGRLAELRVRLTYWKVRLREGCLSLLPTSLERRFRRRRSRLYPVPADHITTP